MFKGDRKMSIIFTLIISIGQLFFCIGFSSYNVWLMIFGRFLFGLGGESLNISMTTILIKWFQGSELSFAQV